MKTTTTTTNTSRCQICNEEPAEDTTNGIEHCRWESCEEAAEASDACAHENRVTLIERGIETTICAECEDRMPPQDGWQETVVLD